MKWGTCSPEAYCRCWGMPNLEWDIHNESQLANVGLIEIQECHSGPDCRSQLCLNCNHIPGHTQQRKAQLHREYPSHISVSDTLGWQSEVCPNYYDISAEAVALPWISKPLSDILSQELNDHVDCVDCKMGLAFMQWWSRRYVPRTLQCTWTLIICQQ